MKMPIDGLDKKLLRVIQDNNRITTEQLGEMVGLSSTACQRRLKKLRSAHVIEKDISVIDPRAVGQTLITLVEVSLERERADIIDRFKSAIRATPEIMLGFYVTGDADFVLVITAQDMEDYENFTRKFFYGNHDIKNFKTMVVIDRVKTGFTIPIR
ncbi:Lrp/AsnC family transcriptional regulator [Klebsiella sp. 2680]|uniref:Lrp/AsnC family transcriptional regulator n=1 Tax=Klebsiella sp. 2680 TaxID=2018037 RepID=UPI001C8DD466|nr:Lrp/AsnC family transcriptional regulator [Klebsiella sp. 2680]